MKRNISVEIPINSKDASRRGLDLSLCKLVISFSGIEKQNFLELARLINIFHPFNTHIFITSVSEFVSLDSVLQNIPEKTTKLLNLNAVKIETTAGLSELLSLWQAEALVIFFANEKLAHKIISDLPSLEPRWWTLSKTNYEIPFLKQLTLSDPFLFFSPSHMSLEILGSRNQITRLKILTDQGSLD